MTPDGYRSYHDVNLGARTARASPVQLVLILTDGLLEELLRARGHILARRYEQKARSLDKCVDMLHGLSSSLDFEGGSGIVHDLERLYEYCIERLYRAGHQLDAAPVDEVSALLLTLRQGWLGLQARHG